jgi:glycine/D-amino acid oxidase-like deaminating enzyme
MEKRIAVVGAGIIGCLVAHEALAANPSAQITLIERDLAGLGASQRSAGVHFPVGRTERVRSMSLYSQRYYATLASRDADVPIFPLDFYAVSAPAAASELRQRFVAPGEFQDAPDRHWVTGWPKGLLVWSVPGCHYADVGALVRLIARQLRDRVTLLEGLAVESIAERRGGVDLRLTTGDKLSAEKLIIAPGPWVNARGWRELTRPLGVRVKKIVAMHFDYPMEELNAAILFPEVDAFIVPLRNRGHWLYSYTCDEWDVSPDDGPLGLSDRNVKSARDILHRYAPDLVPLVRSGRVFCDAYSPSSEPLVTVIGESGNVIFAGAANGSGYRLAPGIANEAVRLLN